MGPMLASPPLPELLVLWQQLLGRVTWHKSGILLADLLAQSKSWAAGRVVGQAPQRPEKLFGASIAMELGRCSGRPHPSSIPYSPPSENTLFLKGPAR